MKGLMRAVDAAGGWEPLAARLGVRVVTLRRWIREGAMPVEQAAKLRRWYGARIRGNLKDTGSLGLLDEAAAVGLDTLTIRRRLGVTDAAFRQWKKRGCVPARHAEKIAGWIRDEEKGG